MAHTTTAAPCGCAVYLHDDQTYSILFCPLHSAAPDLLAACKAAEVACANAGIKLDKAFVWSKGDGTQHGGYGERIYLLDTIRAAIALAEPA